MYEGSDSFGECHSEALVLLHPASQSGQRMSELRQDFQSSVFLLPYLHLLSLPVIQTPFQSHAAALTSLPQPFPAFCLNPADSNSAQVTHESDIIVQEFDSAWGVFFFFLCLWISSQTNMFIACWRSQMYFVTDFQTQRVGDLHLIGTGFCYLQLKTLCLNWQQT